ncbi:toxin-antitoxin system YwqK family antitoxin [Flammeovirga pacifica]|uniref:Toxin-antitoxin system YwqK family antitoxin n=1 Tax=Flammeovirga pacifica TaxID=915059 RepID=A0A1S1YZI0_FLAPC|nr:hypothetical protein [Flammeovirga pacifica]OHX66421.1 hypothetical protein NH26_08655 [Flammeovirga pacifica]
MKTQCFYIDGRIDGKFQSFYENGFKDVVCEYKNGKLEGKYIEYSEDSNGKIYGVKSLKNGLVEGKETYYYDYPKSIDYQITYSKGKKNGDCKQWYPTGQLKLYRIYKNNKLMYHSTYTEGGKKIREGKWDESSNKMIYTSKDDL